MNILMGHGTSKQGSVILRVGPVTNMIVSASFKISPTIFELMYLYGVGIENHFS